jgi:peroxiredoxin
MAIEAGRRIPDARLWRKAGESVEPVSTGEIFAGRRAVLFGVPGAFTPTCSDEHLPGYVERARDLAAAGVERIACVAVNDAWVMDAWGKAHGVGDEILMLADPVAELTRALGLERDATATGLGVRCRRFAAVLEDGLFLYVAVEPARGVTVCGAGNLLDVLRASA